MDKFWIFFGCLAIFSVVGYAENSNDWASEEWYDGEIEKSDVTDKKVEEEIRNEKNEDLNNKGDINDYQIEDNRSEVKEENDDDVYEFNDYFDSFEELKDIEVQDKKSDGNEEYKKLQDSDNSNDENKNDFEQLFKEEGSEIADDIDYELSPVIDEQKKKILEETIDILNEDKDNNFEDIEPLEFDKDKISDTDAINDDTKILAKEADDIDDTQLGKDQNDNENNSADKKEAKELKEENNDFANLDENENPDIEDVLDKTTKALEETSAAFDEDKIIHGFREENISEDELDEDFDEDTVDKAYKDLKDDLVKLRETWNKLRDDVDDGDIKKEDLPGFEEINSKLADIEHEALDNDYEELDDKNLFKIFDDKSEESSYEFDENEEEDFEAEKTDDKIIDKEETEPKSVGPMKNKTYVSDESVKDEKVTENVKLIKYVDDALVANDKAESTTSEVETTSVTLHAVQEHDVEPLEDDSGDVTSSSEFKDLLDNILGNPEKEIDVHKEVKNSVEPKRIILSVDEPVVLTSPNYPDPYPTNTVTEWILEGEGRGIEFNITDFAVNGNNGDHVLVNPGRTDDSGNEGLVFTHMLREERRYRFLNVNRMFIRFHTSMGMMWQRGFSFSIKMIDSLDKDEDISEPESLPIGYPPYTTTLNLGGITHEDFLNVKEDFRRIVADMATMYINANQIDHGLNTTLEVTQITSTALCFRNWPKFEQCVEVRFGVPLQYEDEEAEPRLTEDELNDMWMMYSRQDPFELRLRRLNITEFQIPNDNNILMMWLVIAGGVVISMAMLAFALWRFSCFEDYTRMPAFSDTDSINEKKTLDLYPTPHQTLPPLYSDTEYKWGDDKFEESTRVDMSGFANRSYVRTDDYDFESDEEVVVPARDRNASISPRDMYNV